MRNFREEVGSSQWLGSLHERRRTAHSVKTKETDHDQDEYIFGRILVPIGRMCHDVFCNTGGASSPGSRRIYPIPEIVPACVPAGDGYAAFNFDLSKKLFSLHPF